MFSAYYSRSSRSEPPPSLGVSRDFCHFPTVQVSVAAWERPDSRAHGSPVLQREVQPAAEVPSPALSAGWPGTEAHLPATRGEAKCTWGTNQVLSILTCVNNKCMVFFLTTFLVATSCVYMDINNYYRPSRVQNAPCKHISWKILNPSLT